MEKFVLISVTDKTGIIELSNIIKNLGYTIIATSGTYKYLLENSIKSVEVSDFTGFPEILNGRIKTLHHKIFSGLLADSENECHNNQLDKLKFPLIDIVICNLYNFTGHINDTKSDNEIINFIDIGGVSLIRASAKNFKRVSIITEPSQYLEFQNKILNNNISFEYRKKLAIAAFRKTALYDFTISNYFSGLNIDSNIFDFKNIVQPSYGENPHQKAYIAHTEYDKYSINQIRGNQLSYNNFLDINASLKLIENFNTKPFCAIIKHNNPCGAAYSFDIVDAYKKALNCDPVSAYGGIIIVNKKVDAETAEAIIKTFTEIVIAPGFCEESIKIFEKKDKLRLLTFCLKNNAYQFECRSTYSGFLIQEEDRIIEDISQLKSKTSAAVDINKYDDIWLSLNICKILKSNAIAIANNSRLCGAGCGQPNRIDSVNIAVSNAQKYGISLENSVLASDGFFPFSDSIELIKNLGIKTIIQPGGSKRDAEVISACEKYNISLILTGIRHFLH